MRFDDPYQWYWTYIPHFIYSPFYVYAYAFGDCLVNSLYAAYQEKPDGFSHVISTCCAPEATNGTGPYIPHFIHSPFYVYAYAFGDCLVNSLYAAYQEKPDGFSERYLDMLRAGGSMRHRELLAPFGLDASDPAFWSKGLAMIGGFIDELEALE